MAPERIRIREGLFREGLEVSPDLIEQDLPELLDSRRQIVHVVKVNVNLLVGVPYQLGKHGAV